MEDEEDTEEADAMDTTEPSQLASPLDLLRRPRKNFIVTIVKPNEFVLVGSLVIFFVRRSVQSQRVGQGKLCWVG